jgi:hypothetical protein
MVTIVKGGGRESPTHTSQSYFFHHDGIVRQKAAVATLCGVLCVSNKEKKKTKKGSDFSQSPKF